MDDLETTWLFQPDCQHDEFTPGKSLFITREKFDLVNGVRVQSGQFQLKFGIGTVFPAEDLDHATVFLRIVNLLSVPFRPVVFRCFDQRIDVAG